MQWFSRRKAPQPTPQSEPELPGIWVWRNIPSVGGSSITRFFFKGNILDLPDILSPGAKELEAPFAVLPSVVGVRFHQTYMAVQWWDKASDEERDRIVEVGITVLKDRFGWSEIRGGEIYSDMGLERLRQAEAAHSRMWVIGRG